MTKQGSVVLSIGLLALVIVAMIVAVTRLKPPSGGKTTPSVEPTPRADTDPSGAMGKASGNLAKPPRRPGQSRDPRSPPSQRLTIQAMTTYQLRKAVGAVVSGCVDRLRPEREARPIVQAVVDISVADGILVVKRTRVSVEGLVDNGVSACVRMGAARVRVSAKDHQDVQAHTLTLPFRVRD